MTTSIPRRVLRFGAGAALFGISWAEAQAETLPAYEERVFRWANGADDRLQLPVRAIMQAGTFGRGFALRFAPATFALAVLVSVLTGTVLL